VGTTFQPAIITVSPGTTVTWVSTDDIAHTVTSGTGTPADNAGELFDMPLPANGNVQFTYQNPGVYPYYCRIHQAMGMRGTINVTATTPH
jgi:plastocyanin